MLVERLKVYYMKSIYFLFLYRLFLFSLDLNLQESNTSLHKPSLELLRSQIKSSTSSMTSVPKPLKFLRHHYNTLKDLFNKWPDQENKVSLD